jgi:hypothetical protein
VAATYNVVHLTRDGKTGWAVESSSPGAAPQVGRLYQLRMEAQHEADRLTALAEKRNS